MTLENLTPQQYILYNLWVKESTTKPQRIDP